MCQSTWVVRFNRNCMKRSRLSRSRVRLLFHHRSNVDASKRLLSGEGREKHSRKPLVAQSLAVRNISCHDVLLYIACRQLVNASVQEFFSVTTVLGSSITNWEVLSENANSVTDDQGKGDTQTQNSSCRIARRNDSACPPGLAWNKSALVAFLSLQGSK